jgi:hypothetical protein
MFGSRPSPLPFTLSVDQIFVHRNKVKVVRVSLITNLGILVLFNLFNLALKLLGILGRLAFTKFYAFCNSWFLLARLLSVRFKEGGARGGLLLFRCLEKVSLFFRCKDEVVLFRSRFLGDNSLFYFLLVASA